MAKLGSQLKSQTQEVRETRTQRVRNVQAQQKAKRDYESEVARFENLKVQAKAIQEEQFKDQTVEFDQSYNIYRPKSYSAKSWNRLSAKRKANALKKYQKGRGIEYYARKGYVVVHSTATKKATKVVPFTLEDGENSYKKVYDNLSPDLQQFFDTPDVVLENKATSIATTKQTVQDKLAEADIKIAERTAKYKEREIKLQEWWSNKSSKYRSNSKNREKRKEKKNDYEDDYDEDIAKLKGYKKGLVKGSQQLDQNKDVDIKSIEDYAWDVGRYQEDKEEAKNDSRNDFYDKAKSGELDETFEKLGLDKNKPSYYGFNKKVDAFNKGVAYKNSLIKWSDKVGFDKISKQAQEVLNPSITKWRSEKPTEKLMFDKVGNVAGVESGKLQQSIAIGNYDQAISSYKSIKTTPKTTFKLPPPVNVNTFFSDYQKNNSLNIKSITPPAQYGDWSYNSKSGSFQTPSEPSGQATAFMRPPTQTEQKQFDIAEAKALKVEEFTWGNVKKSYNYVDDRVHWDLAGGGLTPTATLSFGLKKEPTIVESIIDEAIIGVEKKKGDLLINAIGKEKLINLKQDWMRNIKQNIKRNLIKNI